MGYGGQIYQIPCDVGGFTGDQNTDKIREVAIVHPSRNTNHYRGGRETRGGTAKDESTAMSGSPTVLSGHFFRKLSGTSFKVRTTSAGAIYKDRTTTIKASGWTTTKPTSFEAFEDELYAVDGEHIPQTWDGSAGSTSDLSSPATDWATRGYPFQVKKHGRGVSERMWYLTPYALFYSANGNGKNVSGGGTIPIDTGDGYGLIGFEIVNDEIIVFGRTRAWRINDVSSDTADWGYSEVYWEGGAAHWRLLVKIENSLLVMDRTGLVYDIRGVEQFGDLKAAALTRPAFIDAWIKEYVKLASVTSFHAEYDPNIRAVKFHLIRLGQTQVDTALVYFVDAPPQDAWEIHDNQSSASGYKAACAFVGEDSDGQAVYFTGDYSGFIWKLEQATTSDDGNGYYNGFKTAPLHFGFPRQRKRYDRGYVVAKAQGNYSLQVNIWVDGVVQSATTVSLAGAGGTLGSFVLDTDLLGGTEFIDRFFDIKAVGKRIQFEFYLNTAGQKFFASQVLIDFKPLGVRP